jgi:hypothetical protein
MQYKISKKWTLSVELKMTEKSTEKKIYSVDQNINTKDRTASELAAQLRKIGDEMNEEFTGKAKETSGKLMWLISAIKCI